MLQAKGVVYDQWPLIYKYGAVIKRQLVKKRIFQPFLNSEIEAIRTEMAYLDGKTFYQSENPVKLLMRKAVSPDDNSYNSWIPLNQLPDNLKKSFESLCK